MQESDVLLKEISKTGVDRTVINKSSSEPPPQQQQMPPSKRNRSMKIIRISRVFFFL